MLLHMKAKLMSIHNKIEVLDEDDREVYLAESKVISIHNTTFLRTADGKNVATITRRPLTLHEVHTIEMEDGTKFEVSTEWFHVMQDVIDIRELGWTLHGEFLRHDYEILDEYGNTLATTHMKWLSLHNVSYIDILDESKADMIVALCLTLEHILQDRVSTAAGANPSASDNGN